MRIVDYVIERIYITVICVMMSVITLFPQFVLGQEFNLESEMELGVSYFQNAQFKEAFPHFEKISEVLSHSGDEEILPVIYYFCQSCKIFSEDIGGSIPYGEKALSFKTLPSEYQIQVLKSLLSAYDELGMNDKCVLAINELNLLWKSFKVSDIIESLVNYYTNHDEYLKVITFENDLQYFKDIDALINIDKTAQAIQLNTIYMCMAKAHSELKNFNKSILYLEKCIQTLTPYTQDNMSAIYLMMADNYNKMGDKKSALKCQKLAIQTK